MIAKKKKKDECNQSISISLKFVTPPNRQIPRSYLSLRAITSKASSMPSSVTPSWVSWAIATFSERYFRMKNDSSVAMQTSSPESDQNIYIKTKKRCGLRQEEALSRQRHGEVRTHENLVQQLKTCQFCSEWVQISTSWFCKKWAWIILKMKLEQNSRAWAGFQFCVSVLCFPSHKTPGHWQIGLPVRNLHRYLQKM